MRLRVPPALLLVAVLLGAGVSGAATPKVAVAKLNAQRERNGIPGGIALVAAWSKGCALHNRYLKKNKATGHDENPKKKGYTKEGAWAGKNAVLSYGDDWNTVNPWENAPIHLAQLLAPQLAKIGIDDSGGYVCATTWPGYTRHSAANAIFTYPGNGTSGWSPSQTASERPFVPGDFVGLPQGTTTGLHLYVFADGPWLDATPKLQSVSLTGPDGPVEVRKVERTTPKVGGYLPPGGAILIPVKPLRTDARYTAEVTIVAGATTLAKKWTFRTGAFANDVFITSWRWELGTQLVVQIGFRSAAPGGVVTLEDAAGKVLARSEITEAGKATLSVASSLVARGVGYKLCVRSGGGTSGFVEKRACVTLKL